MSVHDPRAAVCTWWAVPGLTQMRYFMGYTTRHETIHMIIYDIICNLSTIHYPSLILGSLSLAFLLVMKVTTWMPFPSSVPWTLVNTRTHCSWTPLALCCHWHCLRCTTSGTGLVKGSSSVQQLWRSVRLQVTLPLPAKAEVLFPVCSSLHSSRCACWCVLHCTGLACNSAALRQDLQEAASAADAGSHPGSRPWHACHLRQC